MGTCKKCGRTVDLPAKYQAIDYQDGKKTVLFCSADCLKKWVLSKIAGICISLGISVVFFIVVCLTEGVPKANDTGLFVLAALFFVPYMIRQIHNSFRDIFNSGHFGEAFPFIIVILASLTFVYPLFALVREILHYVRLNKEYSLSSDNEKRDKKNTIGGNSKKTEDNNERTAYLQQYENEMYEKVYSQALRIAEVLRHLRPLVTYYDYYSFKNDQIGIRTSTENETCRRDCLYFYAHVGYVGIEFAREDIDRVHSMPEVMQIAKKYLVPNVFRREEDVETICRESGWDGCDLIIECFHEEPGREGRSEYVLSLPLVFSDCIKNETKKKSLEIMVNNFLKE